MKLLQAKWQSIPSLRHGLLTKVRYETHNVSQAIWLNITELINNDMVNDLGLNRLVRIGISI